MKPTIPSWWAAASVLAATASAAVLRITPQDLAPQAHLASLFLACAAASCSAAAARKPDLLISAAALAAGTGVACGISAGSLRWPSSDASWLFATAGAWLAAQTAHLAAAARCTASPIRGAQSLPTGVIVYGTRLTACAWLDTGGSVRTWTGPAGPRGVLQAVWILTRETFVAPVLHRRPPKLLDLRRLHAAEHLAVLAAIQGNPANPDAIRGNPITPLCGGTIAALALPAYLLALVATPAGSQAMALLWSVCAAYAVRTAALASPRLRFLLTPGLWLQQLTTAPPGKQESALASAAVRACLEGTPCHPHG